MFNKINIFTYCASRAFIKVKMRVRAVFINFLFSTACPVGKIMGERRKKGGAAVFFWVAITRGEEGKKIL